MADDRVKDIVERFLRGVRWTRYLYACNNHNLHVVRPSYGSTTWTHVGNLYEICYAKPKCDNHQRPLDRQMSLVNRRAMLQEIIDLQPGPYGSEIKRAEAILMRGVLEGEIEAEVQREILLKRRDDGDSSDLAGEGGGPSSESDGGGRRPRAQPVQGSSSVAISSGASSGASSRASSRASSGASSGASNGASSGRSDGSARGAVGRPTNPTTEVIVYVYVPGRHQPLVIVANGTPRNKLIEFTFSQPKVNDALGINGASRQKPTYKFWTRSISDWSDFPKAHHPLFLAPGERVLYRDLYVENTPNLANYIAQLLPCDRERAARPLLAQPPVPGLPPPPEPMKGGRSAVSRANELEAGPIERESFPTMLSEAEMEDIGRAMEEAEASSVAKGKKRAAASRDGERKQRRKTGGEGGVIDLTLDDATTARSAKRSGPLIDLTLDEKDSGGPSKKGKSGASRSKALPADADVIELSD